MTNKKAIKHIKDKIKHIDSCDNALSVFQYALTLVMDLYGQHVPPSDILSIEKDFIDKGIIPAKDKRKKFFSEYKGSQKHKDYICRILYFIRYIKLGKCSSAYDKLCKEDKNDYLVFLSPEEMEEILDSLNMYDELNAEEIIDLVLIYSRKRRDEIFKDADNRNGNASKTK